MPLVTRLTLATLTAATLSLGAAPPAHADYTPLITVLQSTVDVHVRADGSAVSEELNTLRIDTELAVREYGEIRFRYSATLERFEVLEAWTLTPDGRRLDVQPDQIRTLEESDTGEADFSDGKVRAVIFPAAGVGARLVYRVRREQHTPEFPGHFFDLRTFSPHPGLVEPRDAVVTRHLADPQAPDLGKPVPDPVRLLSASAQFRERLRMVTGLRPDEALQVERGR